MRQQNIGLDHREASSQRYERGRPQTGRASAFTAVEADHQPGGKGTEDSDGDIDPRKMERHTVQLIGEPGYSASFSCLAKARGVTLACRLLSTSNRIWAAAPMEEAIGSTVEGVFGAA